MARGFRLVSPDEVEVRPLQGGRGLSYRLLDERTGSGRVELRLNVIAPGSPPGPYHYHSECEDIYVVLAGEALLVVEGEEYRATAGQVAYIAPGVRHCVQNVGSKELRVLEIYAPAGPDFQEAT